MARLPVPGSDEGVWGALLNEFLRVSHHEDGTLRNVCPVANVRDYGAVGGGLTDDTAAIQAALDTEQNVCIPAGNYRISNTLKFYQSQRVFGAGRRWGASYSTILTIVGALPVLQAATKGSERTRYVHIHDLSIYNSDPGLLPGSIGIDLTDVSWSQIERVSLRYHEYGILGADSGVGAGYYNEVISPEIASCDQGVRLVNAANAWHIYGGRINGNNTGVYISGAGGNHVSSAFESNSLGIQFAAGAAKCSVTASYFEGNTGGAIRFDQGAHLNTEATNSFSNGEDTVIDDDGRNISLSPGVVALASTTTGIGSGLNLIPNSSFEVDTSGTGIADHWAMVPTVPTGTTLALDTSQHKFGAKSQRLTIAAAGTSHRSLQLDLAVTPGQRYVFSGWTYVDSPNVFALRIGNSPGDAAYYNSGGLVSTDIWQLHRISFAPTGPSVSIYVYELSYGPGTSDRSIWLDGFKLESGILPTGFYADELPTKKTTIGPAIASGATITPTHQIHHVTGAGQIANITPPPGFAGELILIPDDAWTTLTTGNIKTAITTTVDRPVRCIYDPTMAQWYVMA